MKEHFYSDEYEFISVLIPCINRWNYLEECVLSIEKFADMPYEIVLHDDRSNDGTREKILSELKDKVSCIILNQGLNLGLSESINRASRCAGSKFQIMMNADCRLERPCFKDIVNILKAGQYIGAVFPANPVYGQPNYLENNGTRFYLSRGIGAGWCQAWRKDNFEAIGGWDSYFTTTGNSDVSFMCRMLKNGYFLVNPCYDPSGGLWITNMSNDRMQTKDSVIGEVPEHIESAFPKIFRVDDYKRLSQTRQGTVSERQGEQYRQPAGDINIDYWNKFGQSLIKDNYSLDIELAKANGMKEIK